LGLLAPSPRDASAYRRAGAIAWLASKGPQVVAESRALAPDRRSRASSQGWRRPLARWQGRSIAAAGERRRGSGPAAGSAGILGHRGDGPGSAAAGARRTVSRSWTGQCSTFVTVTSPGFWSLTVTIFPLSRNTHITRCARALQRTNGRHLRLPPNRRRCGRRPLDDAALSDMANDRWMGTHRRAPSSLARKPSVRS
jgi:hypothetical protein